MLSARDMPRGYEYGDDTACGGVSAEEGEWPRLRVLFRRERPDGCVIELEWVWKGSPPYSRAVTSAAYRFRGEDGAHRAFEARDELAYFTGSLSARTRERVDVGDEAELLRGGGLNNPASAVVWRDGPVAAVLVVEPADDAAARELARRQERHIAKPAPTAARERDPELQLDDPANRLPVYWLGRTFDPPGSLPRIELESATVGGNGPGQSVQLWYARGVTLDTWTRGDWARFRRTLLGRLIWDSPCARKRVVRVDGGRAEIFAGYGTPNPLERPCPQRPRDRAIAHVYYPDVVVAVNMPYCYMCASPAGPANPYNSVSALETVVRALSKRSRRHP